MKNVLIVLLVLFMGSTVLAQPYSIMRIFGQDAIENRLYAQDIDGTLSTFTIDAPDFIGFSGSDFDRPRNRVVLIAKETGTAYLISVNPALASASMLILRSGIDENAKRVHVDPDTGRIYWWENDEILSVNSDGTGIPVVEADNVPEPTDDMDIDVDRGFYVVVSLGELMIGNLDGVASAPPISIPSQISSRTQIGVGINPSSGDIFWAESYNAGALTGIATAVYQVSSQDPLATAQRILGSEEFCIGLVQEYRDVAAIGDQVVASSSDAFAMQTKLTVLNTTTNLITAEMYTLFSLGISIAFDVDPILQQPIGMLVNQGMTGVLELVPSDTESSYQWFHNGVVINDNERVSGATTNKLIISDAMPSDTNTYSCTVLATNGDQQMSDEVVFAVRESQTPECTADLNDDGTLNFFDVSAFLQAFGAGCP
ncbi:MAG: immunoglobulin domain-containing protein [Phycisphaerales bacterium]